MFTRLFLLFTVVPAIELWLLIRVGGLVGPLPTVAMVIGSGLLGAYLAKREGWALIRQLQGDLAQGLPPADRVIEGLLVLVGAALMIAPGLLTDATGMLLIFPPVRRFLAPRVKRWLMKKMTGGATFTGQGFSFRMGGAAGVNPEPQRAEPHVPHHFEHPTA